MSRSQVFEWHKRFASGHEVAEDESRLGQSLSTRTNETINQVKALIRSNRRLTVQKISDKCDFWFFPKLTSIINTKRLLVVFQLFKDFVVVIFQIFCFLVLFLV